MTASDMATEEVPITMGTASEEEIMTQGAGM